MRGANDTARLFSARRRLDEKTMKRGDYSGEEKLRLVNENNGVVRGPRERSLEGAAMKRKARKGSIGRRVREHPKPGTSAAAVEARRKHFVEEYVANGGNGTMAAKAVGYSERTAYSIAHRLLKDVEIVAVIKRRRGELQKKYELTAEDIIQKLAEMLHFDVSTLYDEHNRLKPVHLWPPDAASCVQGIEAGPLGVMKVKTIGRLDAVVAAMKHMGLFDKDNRQRAASDPIRELMEYVEKHNEPIPVKP